VPIEKFVLELGAVEMKLLLLHTRLYLVQYCASKPASTLFTI